MPLFLLFTSQDGGRGFGAFSSYAKCAESLDGNDHTYMTRAEFEDWAEGNYYVVCVELDSRTIFDV